jgi:catechol 2,3-dioxygenase-like lactoylglutathione lyase family enzyme
MIGIAHSRKAHETEILATDETLLESEQSPVFIRSATIVTRNAERLAAFYIQQLGFERLRADATSVAMGADGKTLLTLETRPDAEPFDQRSNGLFHIAYVVPDRTALARWFLAARAAGVAFEGASDHAVSEAFYLTDPDGNGIEVYVDRARANWPRDAGGYAMTTGPMALRELVALSRRDAAISICNPAMPSAPRVSGRRNWALPKPTVAPARAFSPGADTTTTSRSTTGAAEVPDRAASDRRGSRPLNSPCAARLNWRNSRPAPMRPNLLRLRSRWSTLTVLN